MPTSPKSLNRMLEAMLGNMLSNASLKDLDSGSALKAMIDGDPVIQKTLREVNLITFLSKLDSRFKKYLTPKP